MIGYGFWGSYLPTNVKVATWVMFTSPSPLTSHGNGEDLRL
jgi:hypothetical protein